MFEILDRLAITLFALLPVGLLLALPAITMAQARKQEKASTPPELLEVLDPADLDSTRFVAEFSEYVASDDQPIRDNVPLTRGGLIRRWKLALPLLILVAWFLPPLAFILSLVITVYITHAHQQLKTEFIEVDQARAALLERAFRIAKEHVRYPGGSQYVFRKWVKVEEWSGLTPKAFNIYFTETFKATERDRFAFEDQWRQALGAQCAWGFGWRPGDNMVICTPLPMLPTKVELPFPFAHEYVWNEIPLGVTATGKVVTWDVKNEPHMLIAGLTSSGKSVQLNAILLHLLQRPDWAVQIADPKDALYMYEESYGCKRFETAMEGILDMMQQYQAENERRKKILKENGMRKWGELPEWITIDGVRVKRPPLLMMVVEEAIDLLADSGVKEVDAMKKEIRAYLLKLAATCRSQGLHLLLVIQRPDAATLGGQFRSQLGARLQVGAMASTDSHMVLGDAAPRNLMVVEGDDPDDPVKVIKGRAAFANSSGEYVVFQGYFSNDDDTSLARYLKICNMLTEPIPSPNGTAAPRFTPEALLGGQTLRGVAPEIAAIDEDDTVETLDDLPVVGRFLAKLPFQVVVERELVYDDEEETEVERSRLRFCRREHAEYETEEVELSDAEAQRQERLRQAREKIMERRRAAAAGASGSGPEARASEPDSPNTDESEDEVAVDENEDTDSGDDSDDFTLDSMRADEVAARVVVDDQLVPEAQAHPDDTPAGQAVDEWEDIFAEDQPPNPPDNDKRTESPNSPPLDDWWN